MRTRRSTAILALALVGGLSLSACSGGSSGRSTPAAGGSPGAAVTGTAVTGASGALASPTSGLGRTGSALDVHKQCAAIKTADVQALLKIDAGSVVVQPLECDWVGQDVQVSIYLNDASKKYYTDQVGGTTHPLAGLGDVAVWYQPVPGRTIPWVDSHKGDVTCQVAPGDDPSVTTLTYTGTPPIVTIADADAAAYAQKEAALCAAVYSVS